MNRVFIGGEDLMLLLDYLDKLDLEDVPQTKMVKMLRRKRERIREGLRIYMDDVPLDYIMQEPISCVFCQMEVNE